jgi:hypothetical protein
MQKAGLPRKTAHCLCVTCASRLFQRSVEEKLARDRTSHKSNALFGYQKPSKSKLQNVSDVLGPAIDTRKSQSTKSAKSIDHSEKSGKDEKVFKESASSDDRATAPTLFDNFPDFGIDLPDVLASIPLPELPDDLLPSIPLPETTSTTNVDNMCTNAVFTNCSINFVVNK